VIMLPFYPLLNLKKVQYSVFIVMFANFWAKLWLEKRKKCKCYNICYVVPLSALKKD